VNKWFRKQYRTDADAKADDLDPNREAPPPIDDDEDNTGKPISVAPPTQHGGVSELGGPRPLKGGYWFIRDRYREEALETVRKDKERFEKAKQEKEEEERTKRQSPFASRQSSPSQAMGYRGGGPSSGHSRDQSRDQPPPPAPQSYGRNFGPGQYMGYYPPPPPPPPPPPR